MPLLGGEDMYNYKYKYKFIHPNSIEDLDPVQIDQVVNRVTVYNDTKDTAFVIWLGENKKNLYAAILDEGENDVYDGTQNPIHALQVYIPTTQRTCILDLTHEKPDQQIGYNIGYILLQC
jgi:hypothetical protein